MLSMLFVELDEIFQAVDFAVIEAGEVVLEISLERRTYLTVSLLSSITRPCAYGKHPKRLSCHLP